MARAEFCGCDGYYDHPEVGRCVPAGWNEELDQEDDWDDLWDDNHDGDQDDDDECETSEPVAERFGGWTARHCIAAGATVAIGAVVVAIVGLPSRRGPLRAG